MCFCGLIFPARYSCTKAMMTFLIFKPSLAFTLQFTVASPAAIRRSCGQSGRGRLGVWRPSPIFRVNGVLWRSRVRFFSAMGHHLHGCTSQGHDFLGCGSLGSTSALDWPRAALSQRQRADIADGNTGMIIAKRCTHLTYAVLVILRFTTNAALRCSLNVAASVMSQPPPVRSNVMRDGCTGIRIRSAAE